MRNKQIFNLLGMHERLVYHNSSKTKQFANILEYGLGIVTHHMKEKPGMTPLLRKHEPRLQ